MNYNDYRLNDIENNLKKARFQPLDIMVTGVTGAGKSTTLNTFFQKTVATVGDGVDPETMKLDSYCLGKYLRFWDTPGLGDGVEIDKQHQKKIIDLLYKTYILDDNEYGWVDTVLIIIEGSSRDMGTTYKLINEVIVPNIQSDRVLIAVNQADVAMKGRHWLKTENKPDEYLTLFLNEQSEIIKRRIKEATGLDVKKPIFYSAKYDYNINVLLDFIIDNMPRERRKLIIN
jgi:hypothetical protein